MLVRVDRHKDGAGTGVNIIPVVTNTKGVKQACLRHVGKMQDIRQALIILGAGELNELGRITDLVKGTIGRLDEDGDRRIAAAGRAALLLVV